MIQTSSILTAASLLLVMLFIAWILIQKRNSLHSHFGSRGGERKIVDLGNGVRISVIEIDGQRLACAIGRTGVTAMQILADQKKADVS